MQSDKEPLFYPTLTNWQDLIYSWQDFYCIAKPEDLFIMGNYDTTTGQTMMIVFETCDEKKLPQGID